MIAYVSKTILDAIDAIPQHYLLNRYPPKYGLYQFLLTLPPNARVLDIGCGNNSPQRVKAIAPNIHYTGIDVSDWNQTAQSHADTYLLTTSASFADTIRNLPHTFDAMIWNHNIEHCDYPYDVLLSVLSRMKHGGHLYIAMPCAESVRFPKRTGTLNYYDDWTHQHRPPKATLINSLLRSYGLQITVYQPRYRPILWAAIGLLQEPFSAVRQRIYGGTWALYGFESIIWATKP